MLRRIAEWEAYLEGRSKRWKTEASGASNAVELIAAVHSLAALAHECSSLRSAPRHSRWPNLQTLRQVWSVVCQAQDWP